MTSKAERLLALLHDWGEAKYQDGRAMASGTSRDTAETYAAEKRAYLSLWYHIRTMTEEDLKSL